VCIHCIFCQWQQSEAVFTLGVDFWSSVLRCWGHIWVQLGRVRGRVCQELGGKSMQVPESKQNSWLCCPNLLLPYSSTSKWTSSPVYQFFRAKTLDSPWLLSHTSMSNMEGNLLGFYYQNIYRTEYSTASLNHLHSGSGHYGLSPEKLWQSPNDLLLLLFVVGLFP
jgi:hypothetical protein